jgi:hypothetical protein
MSWRGNMLVYFWTNLNICINIFTIICIFNLLLL